jgi:hypothetical protein
MPHQLKPQRFMWLLRALVLGSLLLAACVPGAGPFGSNDNGGDPYPYPGPTDDDATPDHEFEFVGVVKSIGPEIWVIGEHEVVVTADTEIGPGVELGALVAVRVHAFETADGQLVAREIRLVDDDHTPEPTHTREPDHTPEATHTREATRTHEPEMTRTPEASRTPGPTHTREASRTPEPTRDHTPEPTHTREPEHTPEPTHTHEPEDTPEPTHTHEPDHTPEPTHTHEPDRTPEPTHTAEPTTTREPTHEPTHTPVPEIEFTGLFTAINGDVWTVGGHSVIVTGETEIQGDPHVGDTVKVHGWPQPDGSVLAREIRKVE